MALASLITLALPAVPAHAWGFPAIFPTFQKYGVEISGGGARYSMADMNGYASGLNEILGVSFPPIHGGPEAGGSLRLWPGESVLLRLSVARVMAHSRDSGLDLDVGAWMIGAGLTGYFNPATRPARFGLGLGLGSIATSGHLRGAGAAIRAGGSGFDFHVFGEVALRLTSQFSLGAQAGLRQAMVDKFEFNGQDAGVSADYSGIFGRIALAFDGASP